MYWIITINNPTPEDLKIKLTDSMTYLIVGKETGENGTFHLQGYCCFKNRQYLTAVKKVFTRAHLEIKAKNSTHAQASDYCKKDGEYVEYGVLPRTLAQVTSARNTHNWEEAFRLAALGRIDDIEPELRVRYYHAFKRIQQDHPTKHKDLDETCGVWYTGPTGCGKSRTARQKYPDFYDKCLNKWWDGYREEQNVLLDDVDTNQSSWIGPFLKRWTDHYPFPAEQKGTTIMIRPKEVVVTSQYSIAEVFADQDAKLIDALERRFKVITMEPVYMPKMPDVIRMDEGSSDESEPRPDTVTPELTLSETAYPDRINEEGEERFWKMTKHIEEEEENTDNYFSDIVKKILSK